MSLLKTFLTRQIFVSNANARVVLNVRLTSTKAKPIETDAKPEETSLKNDNPDAPVEIENPFKKEERCCILCKLKITPDYKNYRLLSQFQSPYTGRIYGRHITGLCKQKQQLVEAEILKAQSCAFMPYYYKDKAFLKDPKLFDPENPIRAHKY